MGKNEYLHPNEELYKDLEAFAGGQIFHVRAAVRGILSNVVIYVLLFFVYANLKVPHYIN